MESNNYQRSQSYIHRAQTAQHFLYRLNQEEVDHLAYCCGKTVHINAPLLAQKAVDETGLGNIPDKIAKKRGKAETTWNEIKDKKTVGIIRMDAEKRLIVFGEPVGVIAGVAPCTNPIATAMFYTMICLKTRNALILSPHPKAIECTKFAVDLMRASIAYAKLPDDIIQVIEEPQLNQLQTLELTSLVMSQADMVIATGGPKLVDAAYHCGRPAYGVGAGNTPVYLHPSADVRSALTKIISGRAFDNGIICASEQHLLVPRPMMARLKSVADELGAYIIEDPAEMDRLNAGILDSSQHLRAEFIGKSIQTIAQQIGLPVKKHIKVLIVSLNPEDIGVSYYSGEKLCPILSLLVVDSHRQAIFCANRLLDFQGRGHSAAIHIDEYNHEEELLSFAAAVPATHIIVNMPAATSSGGSCFNWLTPSSTLGCGAYGKTMPMDTINLTVKQLINYKAVAMPLEQSRIPDAIFA